MCSLRYVSYNGILRTKVWVCFHAVFVKGLEQEPEHRISEAMGFYSEQERNQSKCFNAETELEQLKKVLNPKPCFL